MTTQFFTDTPLERVVFLDIETIEGEPDELKAEFERKFLEYDDELAALETSAMDAQDRISAYQMTCEETEKKPLKKDTDSDEKVILKWQKRLAEIEGRKAEWMDKAACKDSAQIIVVSLYHDGETHAFTWMSVEQEGVDVLANTAAKIQTHVFSDEAEMLKGLSRYLDSIEIITHLTGHNLKGFDLRHLRTRCAVHNVQKPQCWRGKTHTYIYDTMFEFGRNYCHSGEMYKSLEHVCETFRLDTSKLGKGSEVAGMYEAEEYVAIIGYCCMDSIILEKVFNRMEG